MSSSTAASAIPKQLLTSEGGHSKDSTSRCRGSPIPPDSPLLNKAPASPQLQRARQIHRELSRARHFRASRESSRHSSRQGSRQGSRCSTPARGGSRAGSPTRANGINLPINQRPMTGELSFAVRPALGGRKGWMIMPDNGGGTEEDGGDPDALQRVVEMIKEMELCGHAVPERITIKV